MNRRWRYWRPKLALEANVRIWSITSAVDYPHVWLSADRDSAAVGFVENDRGRRRYRWVMIDPRGGRAVEGCTTVYDTMDLHPGRLGITVVDRLGGQR
jgi:hypothetical protein